MKSDPADARKIARYTLDNWTELRQYSCLLYTSTIYTAAAEEAARKQLESVTEKWSAQYPTKESVTMFPVFTVPEPVPYTHLDVYKRQDRYGVYG